MQLERRYIIVVIVVDAGESFEFARKLAGSFETRMLLKYI